MKKVALALAIFLVLNSVLWFYFTREEETVVESPMSEPAPISKQVPFESENSVDPVSSEPVKMPVTELQYPQLPLLRDSDGTAKELLTTLATESVVKNYFILDKFIQRTVITVDNLARKHAPSKYFPLKPVTGKFLAEGTLESSAIKTENYRRYLPYVRLLEKLDLELLVDVYIYFYPLFQEAYDELGFGEAQFNNRLLFVIEHLLTTPPVETPFELYQPRVMYEFKNPELESMSAGRKILLRMGPDNKKRVEKRLEKLRELLVRETVDLGRKNKK